MLKFPLLVMTVVSGVMVRVNRRESEMFFIGLFSAVRRGRRNAGTYSRLSVDMDRIHSVDCDQNPSVNQPVQSATYFVCIDEIRNVCRSKQGA